MDLPDESGTARPIAIKVSNGTKCFNIVRNSHYSCYFPTPIQFSCNKYAGQCSENVFIHPKICLAAHVFLCRVNNLWLHGHNDLMGPEYWKRLQYTYIIRLRVCLLLMCLNNIFTKTSCQDKAGCYCYCQIQIYCNRSIVSIIKIAKYTLLDGNIKANGPFVRSSSNGSLGIGLYGTKVWQLKPSKVHHQLVRGQTEAKIS